MKITISTPLAPTENTKKILKALTESFPGANFAIKKDRIFCETEDLNVLIEIKKKIEEKRISNTVRYLVLEHHRIDLNKQALIAGRINFVEEEYPMRNVIIEFENEKEALNYLTPSTI